MSIAFFSDARDEAAEKCPTRDASPPLEVAFLNKIGSGSDIQNESFGTFVLNIAHLALSLQRLLQIFMKNEQLKPDYIFETSWEVCNKVGGIYTVLSSRA